MRTLTVIGGATWCRLLNLSTKYDKGNVTGDCCTYFIQERRFHEGSVKIGRTIDMHNRMKSISSCCPRQLVVLAVIRGDVEAEMHSRFSDSRIHGEWFQWSDELAAYINDVRAAAGVAPHQATCGINVDLAEEAHELALSWTNNIGGAIFDVWENFLLEDCEKLEGKLYRALTSALETAHDDQETTMPLLKLVTAKFKETA